LEWGAGDKAKWDKAIKSFNETVAKMGQRFGPSSSEVKEFERKWKQMEERLKVQPSEQTETRSE
jgi:alpha-glucuronidase